MEACPNGGGVKNKQAQTYLKYMTLQDLCFFYHSGFWDRQVVTVVREWYHSEDGGGAVDVMAVGEMRRPVGLKKMRRYEVLKNFALIKQPRLSVVPMSEDIWRRICVLGGGYEGDGRQGGGYSKDDEGEGEGEGEGKD